MNNRQVPPAGGLDSTCRFFRVLGVREITRDHPDDEVIRAFWSELLQHPDSIDASAMFDRKFTATTRFFVGIGAREICGQRVVARNYLRLWVDDINCAVQWVTENGLRFLPGSIRMSSDGEMVCSIFRLTNSGQPAVDDKTVIELVQAPGQGIEFKVNTALAGHRALFRPSLLLERYRRIST